MLERILNRLPAEQPTVIVGDQPSFPTTARVTREKPALSGPVSAIAAGVSLVQTPQVAIIAVDMPFVVDVINALEGQLTDDVDGVVPVNSAGIRQGLAGLYWTARLHTALSTMHRTENASVKSLLSCMTTKSVVLPDSLLIDLDTPEDVAAFNERTL